MRDERLFPIFQSLDALPGIGPKLKPTLERLVGGETIWDILLHMPERWIDRRPRDQFDDVVPDEVEGELEPVGDSNDESDPEAEIVVPKRTYSRTPRR